MAAWHAQESKKKGLVHRPRLRVHSKKRIRTMIHMAVRRNRLILWLLLGFAGLIIALFFTFDGYVIVRGVINGERFYRGMPSSSWSKKIKRGELHFSWGGQL